MSVQFSVRQRINPSDLTAPRKYYAIAASKDQIDLRSLSNEIARISTVSTIDTIAVLEGLVQLLPDYLIDGRSVQLGDFGTFRLTLSSGGAETEEAFSTALIKKSKLHFRPGKLIRNALKTISYEKV